MDNKKHKDNKRNLITMKKKLEDGESTEKITDADKQKRIEVLEDLLN